MLTQQHSLHLLFTEVSSNYWRTPATLVRSVASTSCAGVVPTLSLQLHSGRRLVGSQRVAAVHSAEGSVHVAGDLPRQNGVNQAQHFDLGRKDHAAFVHFFRAASSYITGHRGSLIVIVLPGQASHK